MLKVILNIVELARRLSLSYGQFLVIMSTVIGQGSMVVKATWLVLQHKKYEPVMIQFQKGVLHLIAAVTDFKSAFRLLEQVTKENPDDFAVAKDFTKQVGEDLTPILKQIFESPMNFMNEMDSDLSSLGKKLPMFIRTSGEYMDFINAGKVEVSEEQFKATLLKGCNYYPATLIRVISKIKKDIKQYGWATLRPPVENADDKSEVLILWADTFDVDLPTEVAEELRCEVKWPYDFKRYEAEDKTVKSEDPVESLIRKAVDMPHWPFPTSTKAEFPKM